MAKDFGVEFVAVLAGGAAAEELFRRKKLLMDFESGFETEVGVIALGHLGKGFDGHEGDWVWRSVGIVNIGCSDCA